jgi:fluoroquinolone transport system permease protein
MTINFFHLTRALAPADLLSLRRDPFLAWMILLPAAVALFLRVALAPLAAWLARTTGFDLWTLTPVIMGSYLALAPLLVGLVTGFLLLDARDEGSLAALRTTPVRPADYLLYRLSLPLGLGVVVTLVCYPLVGQLPLPLADLLAVALLAAFAAPLMALALAGFAENKVAGLALFKGLNVLVMLPIAAYFLPMPWQLAAGIIPVYWPLKVLWLAASGAPYGWAWVVGLAVNGVAVWLLLRRFSTHLENVG